MNTGRSGRFHLVGLAVAVLLGLVIQPALGAPSPRAGGAVEGQDRWLPFGEAGAPAAPGVAVVASSPSEVRLKIEVPGAWVGTVKAPDGTPYARLSVPEAGWSAELGQPMLPVVRQAVEIPYGASYRLEVLSTETTEVRLADAGLLPLVPRQPPAAKCEVPGADAPWEVDPAAYASDVWLPAQVASVSTEAVMRGHRTVLLEVWPVAYNPAAGALRLAHRLEVRLVLEGADVALTAEKAARYASPAFDARLRDRVLNYNQGAPAQPYSLIGTGYLIITADAFYDSILPLANWKTLKGHEVTVTRISEVPGGGSGAAIRAYIIEAYTTWPTPPSFVLIVGDVGDVPSSPAGGTTDLYYAAVDGSDFLPDLGVGRFPGQTPTQISAMVDKVYNYENAIFPDPGYLGRASFIASDDPSFWGVAEGTHNYVIDTHTAPFGFLGTFPTDPQPGGDKLYAVSYGAGTSDLLTHMGPGRWAIIYSGHGSTSSWAGPSFSQANVHQLANDGMPAFVGSHACVTGSFQLPECFGETWIREPNKGALAFWGASVNTYWDEDDELERVAFDTLFTDGVYDIAGITQGGLYGVYLAYPGSAQYYYEGYNVLGDPATELWLEVAVGTLNGTVTDCVSGAPIEGAMVTATKVARQAGLDAVTDPNGFYETFLAPGTYDVGFSHPDYYGTLVTGVEIVEDQVTTQDVCLDLAPPPVALFEDDMESGDGNWEHAADPGVDDWALVQTDSHSPTHAWFSADVGSVSDKRLWQAVPVSLPTDAEWTHLSFWHHYDFESNYDGGVLEISTDGGGTWDDLGDALVQHGYNATLSSSHSNPLGGRDAWSGDSGGWVETVADLTAYQGQAVQVRFRLGTDSSVADVGWWIDDVRVQYRPLSFQDTMFVGNIKMKYRIVSPGVYKVLGRVPVFDQALQPVLGAEVTAQWALPHGNTAVRAALTRPNGSAYFKRTSQQVGLYTLTVLDVQAAGYAYDPAQNFETSEELQVP